MLVYILDVSTTKEPNACLLSVGYLASSPRRTLTQFWSLKIRRLTSFLLFENDVPRIMRLQNCGRFDRAPHTRSMSHRNRYDHFSWSPSNRHRTHELFFLIHERWRCSKKCTSFWSALKLHIRSILKGAALAQLSMCPYCNYGPRGEVKRDRHAQFFYNWKAALQIKRRVTARWMNAMLFFTKDWSISFIAVGLTLKPKTAPHFPAV